MNTLEESPEKLDYDSALKLYEAGAHPSVEAAQTAHRLEHRLQKLNPASLEELDQQEAKIAEEREKIEQQRADLLSATAAWDRALTEWETLDKVVQVGEQQCSELRALIRGRTEWLYNSGEAWGCTKPQWITNHQNYSAPGLANMYAGIVGAEKALADFPNWLAKKEAEIAAVEARLITIAIQHNIVNRLPTKLQDLANQKKAA